MTGLKLFYLFGMLFGGFALPVSIYQAWAFSKDVRGKEFSILWRYRLGFLLFFVISYAVIFWLNFIDYLHESELKLLIGGLLLSVGLFTCFDSVISRKVFVGIENSNKALATANVHMAALYVELDELKDTIEAKKNQLDKAYQELQQAQSQMVLMEKMAALGQLIAGISHEINTPIAAINASSANILELLNSDLPKVFKIFEKITPQDFVVLNHLVTTSLAFKGSLNTKENRQKRKQIESFLDEHGIEESEVLANILSEMHIYDHLEKILSTLKQENSSDILHVAYTISRIYESSRTIEMSTRKLKKIVFSLKAFSHTGMKDEPVKFNLKQNIDNTILLYQNQIKYGVEFIFNYDDTIPELKGYEDELAQIWTNLIHNSLQSMDYKGSLTIDCYQDDDYVYIAITDSGKGIPKELEHKIFEPFFTTKSSGEGTGLGLHIVTKIVNKHGGSIGFVSEPGKTVFTVKLPKNFHNHLKIGASDGTLSIGLPRAKLPDADGQAL